MGVAVVLACLMMPIGGIFGCKLLGPFHDVAVEARFLVLNEDSSQAEEADREASLRGTDSSADSSHTTRPCSARCSTFLPVVSTFAGTLAQFGKTDLFARLNDWPSFAHCSLEPPDYRAGSLVPAGG
jgi:hypothetical protein